MSLPCAILTPLLGRLTRALSRCGDGSPADGLLLERAYGACFILTIARLGRAVTGPAVAATE